MNVLRELLERQADLGEDSQNEDHQKGGNHSKAVGEDEDEELIKTTRRRRLVKKT